MGGHGAGVSPMGQGQGHLTAASAAGHHDNHNPVGAVNTPVSQVGPLPPHISQASHMPVGPPVVITPQRSHLPPTSVNQSHS